MKKEVHVCCDCGVFTEEEPQKCNYCGCLCFTKEELKEVII